jgi:nucleoside-diphosphate-sugar epimerase
MQTTETKKIFDQFTHSYFENEVGFSTLARSIGDQSFFITGGSGLFGRWILSFFRWSIKKELASPQVTILSRTSVPSQLSDWQFIQGDITDFQWGNLKVDYTMHLAAPSAQATFLGMNEIEKFNTLSSGISRLLQFAHERTIKRVLISSSGAIYGGFGPERALAIAENESNAPLFATQMQALGLGKRVVEFFTKEFCDAGYIDASVARCFSFIGPGLPTNLHYAAGNFVDAALNGKDIVIKGDGKPIRSFMYLGDMVLWFLTILLAGRSGQDYNVGSREQVNIYQLASMVRNKCDLNLNITVVGGENKTAGNPINYFYVPDTSKAELDLKLECKTGLDKALDLYIDYVKKVMSKR